jgi:hypothetical protein
MTDSLDDAAWIRALLQIDARVTQIITIHWQVIFHMLTVPCVKFFSSLMRTTRPKNSGHLPGHGVQVITC